MKKTTTTLLAFLACIKATGLWAATPTPTPVPALAVYDAKRTYLVSTAGNSYLVRGNQPLNADGTFAYSAIAAKLKTLIGPNFNMGAYQFIDVSLIDNQGERTDLQNEFQAFGIPPAQFNQLFPTSAWPPYFRGLTVTTQYGQQVNGNPGSVVWYPCQGCTGPANCATVENQQYNFSGEIQFLNNLLQSAGPKVIYYHCEHGHDRTSSVTAAYMMQYMGISPKQAITSKPPKGAKAFKHPWAPTYLALAKWYATTLTFTSKNKEN